MLVSFIIPVYNVEQYLSTCLDSIMSQGLDTDDFEIILVEDRSTDGSLQICRDYCSKYNNITLIENENNLGLGLTRNRGMKIAKGDYIHFIDSDDYLYPDSLRILLSLNVITKSPDIICFDSSDNRVCTKLHNQIIYEGAYNNSCFFSNNLCVWRYWFKRTFLIDNNIYSQNKKTGQDAIFTFSALSKNPYIIIATTVVYFYRHRNESITSNTDISFVNCLFEVADEIRKISAPDILTNFYISEICKNIIGRFYKCRRTLQECIEFKRKMKSLGVYERITKGSWYLQLSRVPLLLYFHLLKKR